MKIFKDLSCNVRIWPGPVHRIAENHAWRIAAYWPGPVRNSWRVPIAGPGQKWKFAGLMSSVGL